MLQIIRNIRIISPLTRRTVVNVRWFSDEDSSDDEKKKKVLKSSEHAHKRLQELLNSMSTTKVEGSANVIKAKNKRKEELKNKNDEPDSKDIRIVTKRIAEKIGGDVKRTEAELLSSLLGLTEQKSNLSEIIGGLKVEKEEAPKSKAHGIRQAISMAQKTSSTRPKRTSLPPVQRREKNPATIVSVDLFGAQGLNIFEKANDKPDICKTWASLEAREMRLSVTHPPRNYFEKMALWTEQGKIWKFPIDNEQGWDEEHQTDFTEHVMLEMHLEEWCPTKGPIRHFMELVCVGLSKNNFLSAKEKYDHIMWYKGYFEEKREALGNLMTLGIEEGVINEEQLQIQQ